jgi:transcriptional regulator with XRE-family HTH domain
MNIDCKLIGKELKSLRIKQNKSKEKASEDLGIHFNTLNKYEKDASDMSLKLLEKTLDYYGIDELIFFKMIREYNHTLNG